MYAKKVLYLNFRIGLVVLKNFIVIYINSKICMMLLGSAKVTVRVIVSQGYILY